MACAAAICKERQYVYHCIFVWQAGKYMQNFCSDVIKSLQFDCLVRFFNHFNFLLVYS